MGNYDEYYVIECIGDDGDYYTDNWYPNGHFVDSYKKADHFYTKEDAKNKLKELKKDHPGIFRYAKVKKKKARY